LFGNLLIQYERKTLSMVKIVLVLNKCDGETLANLTKQNTQQKGKGRTKKKGLKFELEAQKPKVGHKWAKEQIMFQSPHRLQEAYKKGKGNKI
jgi:hypothetical protein